MDEINFETVAFVLMAVSLPLISFGATGDVDPVWILGFALLAIGTAIPPIYRFTGTDDAAA